MIMVMDHEVQARYKKKEKKDVWIHWKCWCGQWIDELDIPGKWAEGNGQREDHLKLTLKCCNFSGDKVKDKTLGVEDIGGLEEKVTKPRQWKK